MGARLADFTAHHGRCQLKSEGVGAEGVGAEGVGAEISPPITGGAS